MLRLLIDFVDFLRKLLEEGPDRHIRQELERMNEMEHRMVEVGQTSRGYVRYHCPICGRKIAKRYPDPERGIVEDTIIVARGNPYALHSGGGSNIDGIEMEFGTPEEKPDDEALLAPWRAYLDTLED